MDNLECSICLESIDIKHKKEDNVILPCRHWFHRDCIYPWWGKICLFWHCPYCNASSEDRWNGVRHSIDSLLVKLGMTYKYVVLEREWIVCRLEGITRQGWFQPFVRDLLRGPNFPEEIIFESAKSLIQRQYFEKGNEGKNGDRLVTLKYIY